MKFDKQAIIALAQLSKLSLSETEISKFSQQLSDILAFVDKLAVLKLSTAPAGKIVGKTLKQVSRQDQVVAWDQVEKELALGQKKREAGLVVAPKIS